MTEFTESRQIINNFSLVSLIHDLKGAPHNFYNNMESNKNLITREFYDEIENDPLGMKKITLYRIEGDYANKEWDGSGKERNLVIDFNRGMKLKNNGFLDNDLQMSETNINEDLISVTLRCFKDGKTIVCSVTPDKEKFLIASTPIRGDTENIFLVASSKLSCDLLPRSNISQYSNMLLKQDDNKKIYSMAMTKIEESEIKLVSNRTKSEALAASWQDNAIMASGLLGEDALRNRYTDMIKKHHDLLVTSQIDSDNEHLYRSKFLETQKYAQFLENPKIYDREGKVVKKSGSTRSNI